jgi:hypothetical protein
MNPLNGDPLSNNRLFIENQHNTFENEKRSKTLQQTTQGLPVRNSKGACHWLPPVWRLQCVPDTDRPSERFILRYRMENPDQTIASMKTQKELQLIKSLIEAGSTDPNYVYEYQGLILDAEYQVVDTNSGAGEYRVIRKSRILDAYPVSEEDLMEKILKEVDIFNDLQ